MLFRLQIWRLNLFMVLGRVYNINVDGFQRTCLRAAWGPRKLFAVGPRPEKA